jgi:hypothetical protein
MPQRYLPLCDPVHEFVQVFAPQIDFYRRSSDVAPRGETSFAKVS